MRLRVSFPQHVIPTLMTLKPFRFAMLSHVGRVRTGNEDTCAASPDHGLFVVCDGMGGAAAGEVASALAARTFLQSLAQRSPETAHVRLAGAVRAANHAVHQHAQRHPAMKGMGTTLVSILLETSKESNPILNLAHVGDSRCYRFRAGALAQLTADHSFVEEQVRMGEITAAQAATHPMRNIITRVVGTQPSVEPDIARHDPEPGDLFLLASDGLTRDLGEADLVRILSEAASQSPEPDLPGLCQTLIDQANQAGGGDNVTVLLLHIC